MIRRPVEVVAAWAAEPEDAPIWYDNINTVEWKTPPSLRVGRRVALRVAGRRSRVAFVARCLGRRPTGHGDAEGPIRRNHA
jgi:hypothetical protein